jgi:hypothetical protein
LLLLLLLLERRKVIVPHKLCVRSCFRRSPTSIGKGAIRSSGFSAFLELSFPGTGFGSWCDFVFDMAYFGLVGAEFGAVLLLGVFAGGDCVFNCGF